MNNPYVQGLELKLNIAQQKLAAAEVAFKNEVQIVIEQRDSIESLIWRFRDIQFPRDAVQTAIDLAKEEK